MPFVKGQSGNPGGKPKELRNVQLQARKISPLALRELKRILNDPQAGKQAKIAAAEVVLNRAWGRPSQQLEHTGENGGAIMVKLETPLSDIRVDA
jgi:hypothetical protein